MRLYRIFCSGSPVIAGNCDKRGIPVRTCTLPFSSFHTRPGVPDTPNRSINWKFAPSCAWSAFDAFADAIPPS
jgi:hypothetical protein